MTSTCRFFTFKDLFLLFGSLLVISKFVILIFINRIFVIGNDFLLMFNLFSRKSNRFKMKQLGLVWLIKDLVIYIRSKVLQPIVNLRSVLVKLFVTILTLAILLSTWFWFIRIYYRSWRTRFFLALIKFLCHRLRIWLRYLRFLFAHAHWQRKWRLNASRSMSMFILDVSVRLVAFIGRTLRLLAWLTLSSVTWLFHFESLGKMELIFLYYLWIDVNWACILV